MVKKTTYNKTSINKLPNDKPVLYKIESDGGNLNYAGIAQKGRVNDRINEHLGEIPGATVSIEQFSSVKNARAKEKNQNITSKINRKTIPQLAAGNW